MLTIKEVANRLKVSIKTVRRLIDAGELVAHRVGRGIRVSETDLENYINKTTMVGSQ
jgi:excisionase family DNA binding protein